MKKLSDNFFIKRLIDLYNKVEVSRHASGGFLYDRLLIKELRCDSYSQYGQDVFINSLIFGGKVPEGGGFFLDVGGNDPVVINNTLLFEKKGWKGMAFEPIKSQADKWPAVRKTPCYNVAIGQKEDTVAFTEMSASTLSRIGGGHTAEGAVSATYMVKQRKLSNILKENNIKQVDVLFIDVEGYEYNVLNGIDFNAVNIVCVCIENNKDNYNLPDMKLRKYMVAKGYRLIARLSIDDIFVHNDYFK